MVQDCGRRFLASFPVVHLESRPLPFALLSGLMQELFYPCPPGVFKSSDSKSFRSANDGSIVPAHDVGKCGCFCFRFLCSCATPLRWIYSSSAAAVVLSDFQLLVPHSQWHVHGCPMLTFRSRHLPFLQPLHRLLLFLLHCSSILNLRTSMCCAGLPMASMLDLLTSSESVTFEAWFECWK